MRKSTALMLPLALILLASTGGCAALEKAAGSVKAPSAGLNRVDLLDAPTARQATAWACYQWLEEFYCEAAGFDSKPSKEEMKLSFDIVFDMTNENTDLPIPLVEFLLGVKVIEDTNLGSVCVSFCDPEDEECAPGANQEGACVADDETTEVTDASDLAPTVDDLVDLAEDVLSGEFDNGDWRVIPAGETVESHIEFTLGIDTTFKLAKAVVLDAAEDFIAGSAFRVEVPYTLDGTMFFNVPEMGEYAVGFGPFSDVWPIE
jgi:hypothetical protein